MEEEIFELIGEKKELLPTPALLIDLDSFEFNIATMADYFRVRPIGLRPHYKTHKSPIIAMKQIQAGAIGITCAKLSEAEDILGCDIPSILIANQIVGPSKISRLAEISKVNQVIVAIDSPQNVQMISEFASDFGSVVNVLVEVNVGLNRCGVQAGEDAIDLAKFAYNLSGIRFMGVLGYEGHAVLEPNWGIRSSMVNQAMKTLVDVANSIRNIGIPVEIVSAGGTGTYNITGMFPGITEVEAGSYIFMDTKYQQLNLPFKNSVSLLATVISTPTPMRAVIDAGLKSISTDNGSPQVNNPKGINLIALHEEHGIIQSDSEKTNLSIGEKLEIIPSHICTTVNLHDVYYGLRGNIVETIWPITGRGKSQ